MTRRRDLFIDPREEKMMFCRSRTRILFLITVAVALLLLAACSSAAPTAAPEAGEAPTVAAEEGVAPEEAPAEEEAPPDPGQEAQSIEFWIPSGAGRDGAVAAVVEAFEAEYPHISVEVNAITFNEFLNSMQVAYAGDNPPDVSLTNGVAIQNLAYNGALMPIDDIFSEEDLADFMPDLIDMVTLEGQMYGAPWAQSGNVMYYNVDMFEAAGIEPPSTLDETWTWLEFVENVNAVRDVQAEQGNEVWGMVGLDNPLRASYFTWTMIRSNSSPGEPLWQGISPDWTTVSGYIDTPEALEAYEWYQSLYTEGFMPSDTVPDAFGNGQSVTFFAIPPTGNVLSNTFPDLNWAAMPIPYHKTPMVHTGSFAPTISAKADNPEAAKLFVQFFTSREGYLTYHAVNQQLPARVSLQDDLPELQGDGYLALTFDEVLEWGVARPGGPAHTIFDSIVSTDMMVNIALGADIEEAVSTAVQEAEAQLAQFR